MNRKTGLRIQIQKTKTAAEEKTYIIVGCLQTATNNRMADYGESLINELSRKLTKEFGKGFDASNLWYMRRSVLSLLI
jgi:hypothetical protein